ncbi:MAG: carbamoyl phosphate synthase small subunit [Oscillospiraceae bacterium]|jgi:carbamoyl-phosphate synthase small subunit|nr:carbamoyl phosphate synthase small subunit [Oscillospiraceae bacterium]
MSENKVYIILENGKVFEGKPFGAKHQTVGELVFTTAMTGYLETLTDPSYYGQVVTQTFPLIGNYGVIPVDFESRKPFLTAYVVREWCQDPSNFRCEGVLDTFLTENNIPGVYDVDTRELTRIVRESGVMNCMITYDLENMEQKLQQIRSYVITDAVKNTTVEQTELFAADPDVQDKLTIVLYDFGAKSNIARELQKRGCDVYVVPGGTSAQQALSYKPDGIMLSNGPGDPSENTEIIEELKNLAKSGVPIFGICLGHQLLALSRGGKTAKLKYGHRGGNQPVKCSDDNKVYITSQNHGYAVVSESMGSNAVVNYVNVNDGTCEGVRYSDFPGYTVQFHPEACCGPKDTEFLFDKFIDFVKEKRVNN